METALGRLRDYLVSYFPVDCLVLVRFDYEQNCITPLAQHGDKTKTPPFPETLFIRDGAEQVDRFFKATSPLSIVRKPEENDFVLAWAHQTGIFDASVMQVMLDIEGERMGCLVTTVLGQGRYTPRDGALFRLLKEPAAMAMSNALGYRELQTLQEELQQENRLLIKELSGFKNEHIIGETTGLSQVMEMVDRVAPTPSPVLLLGETGVGKEVIANAIFDRSPRREGPFIKVNCGAINESIMDSELFGHEKGAFTGAHAKRKGRFERANGETIFLDEVGELSPGAQVKLLRVLQNREIERVGGSSVLPLDVRVIAATHRHLPELVRAGRFREDLWFRLNVLPITIIAAAIFRSGLFRAARRMIFPRPDRQTLSTNPGGLPPPCPQPLNPFSCRYLPLRKNPSGKRIKDHKLTKPSNNKLAISKALAYIQARKQIGI